MSDSIISCQCRMSSVINFRCSILGLHQTRIATIYTLIIGNDSSHRDPRRGGGGGGGGVNIGGNIVGKQRACQSILVYIS